MVREIVRVPEITSVPNAPDYIEGVINLRGQDYPMVDLRKRFGEKMIEAEQEKQNCGGGAGNRCIGLIVNSASEVIKIPPSDIEAPHSVFQEGELNYITGVETSRTAGDDARSEQIYCNAENCAGWRTWPKPPRHLLQKSGTRQCGAGRWHWQDLGENKNDEERMSTLTQRRFRSLNPN